jgi:hypothetical protein
MIVVLPHGESQYPGSIVWLQSCGWLPDSWCTIRIVYSYELPEYIYEAARFRPEQCVPYLKAIRGSFASVNTMSLHGEKSPPQPKLLPLEFIVTRISVPYSDTLVTVEGTVRDSTTHEKLEGGSCPFFRWQFEGDASLRKVD